MSDADPGSHLLDPRSLSDHIDKLFRAAWAMCGSRYDAEDLVQETFARVLKRPRKIRNDDELGYLMRALRNTHASMYRSASRRPPQRQLFEDDGALAPESAVSAREIMEAIASAPEHYREAVVAVDVLGMSYREAADSLGTGEATVTSRVHRGRLHVAGKLRAESAVVS